MVLVTFPALAVTVAMAALSSTVHAHGGMISPESREIRTMGLDLSSSFGWPISMRPGGDCLNNKADTNLQTVAYGTSKIRMQANDGANHIGPCTVYLVDPSDSSNKLQVGQLDDCMRSLHPAAGNKGDPPIYAEMSIDIPESGLPCSADHCVLEFYWEATHLEPHELFNNCADITLGGGGADTSGSTTTTSAPAATTGAPATTTTAPATTTAAPTTTSTAPATTTASSGAGTYVAVNVESGLQSAMDSWCNANCNNNPPYCPDTTCKAA